MPSSGVKILEQKKEKDCYKGEMPTQTFALFNFVFIKLISILKPTHPGR